MTSTDFNYQLNNHQTALKSFAYKFTKDQDDANDLVQDTLLKAINYATQFKDGTNFKGWLYTIMRNTFINNYRRSARSQALITVNEEIPSAQLHYSATVNSGDGKFMMQDIYKALDKLQPEYSTPFLKYFEGYKYHEIADMLNIPIGTVKTRIHLARQILKNNLKMYVNNFSKVN
ncbi:RNA polymerase sigma factor [Pedobacter sp. MC2016-14]|uniref:RNA polymerase sigma factor n=1 Tax=Pedobacter sp. MC2016-14 TaxID=2897327 RepID=UPI001E57CE1F|nr:RNA polymerase sigma factor [Pedobacter sp. MC2016-14]MCD0489868.1 RNA polymerase sigma factor [Pedobacter sp. MC2016-14]